jgi:hypothetical protein
VLVTVVALYAAVRRGGGAADEPRSFTEGKKKCGGPTTLIPYPRDTARSTNQGP